MADEPEQGQEHLLIIDYTKPPPKLEDEPTPGKRSGWYIELERGKAKPDDLRAALDAIGVEPGESFLIAKDRPLTQAEMSLNFTPPDGRNWRMHCETRRLAKLIEEARALGIDTHTPDNRVMVDPGANQLGHFARDSETSRQAALMNYPKSGSQRWTVLRYVAAAGTTGRTRDELVAELNWPPNVVSPRVLELIEGGWLIETPQTRPTRSGAEASVCVASEQAMQKVTEEASRERVAG